MGTLAVLSTSAELVQTFQHRPVQGTLRASISNFWEYFSFQSECIPHLKCTFLLCKNEQSDSSTSYECVGLVHTNHFLIVCCMCTGMIQSLEWRLSWPITVAGIVNLYLNFCQRWYLTLFKLSSLLLFFLKQCSS